MIKLLIVNLKRNREAILAYLCGVNMEHIRMRWSSLETTTADSLAADSDFQPSDPLMAFYCQTKPADRKRNAIHLYLIFEGVIEDIPNAYLVDQKRDRPVYDTVVDHIFGPMIDRLITETGLGYIVASSPFSREESLLKAIITKTDFVYSRSLQIIAPILHEKLRDAYFQDKLISISSIHKEVKTEIFKKLKRGLGLAENPEIEQYARGIERERAEKISQKMAKVLQRLSFSEKRILEMAFGLKSSDNRGS